MWKIKTQLEFADFSSISDCISIKDIRAGSKNINVIFIVLENSGPVTITKENREVRTFKVGDPTACINLSIWDEPGKLLIPGDIVRLTKGYAAIWRSCLTLYSGKNGDIHKIGDFCLTFNEQLNMSEPNPMVLNSASSTPLIMNNGTVNNGTNSNNNGNNSNNNRQPIQGPQQNNPTNSSTSASSNKSGLEKEKRSNRNNQAKSNMKSDRR